jgi:FMNH2-dependent dimethyl sulfone monooxygenase
MGANRTMQFGLYAPIPMVTVGSPEIAQAVTEALHPLPDGRRDAQFDHSVELLTAADEAGFVLSLFAERHLGNDMHAWIMASAIAARFERIRALVAVHPGLWDPVMTAKMAVSLDRICKGRMAINIVNGWFDEEFKMFGGSVLQGEERYQRASEFIDILRGLWTNESFSYDGQHYKIDNARLLLKPATPTPPEIFSVSRADRGLQFISEYSDWWFIDIPKEIESTDEVLRSIENSVADMKKRCEQSGRKVRFALNPFVALGDSEEQALETTVQRIFTYDPDADARKIERRMIPATRVGCVGPREKVLKQLRRFEDLGVELILCKLIPSVDNIRLIGRELIEPMNGHVSLAMAN